MARTGIKGRGIKDYTVEFVDLSPNCVAQLQTESYAESYIPNGQTTTISEHSNYIVLDDLEVDGDIILIGLIGVI